MAIGEASFWAASEEGISTVRFRGLRELGEIDTVESCRLAVGGVVSESDRFVPEDDESRLFSEVASLSLSCFAE